MYGHKKDCVMINEQAMYQRKKIYIDFLQMQGVARRAFTIFMMYFREKGICAGGMHTSGYSNTAWYQSFQCLRVQLSVLMTVYNEYRKL